MASLIDIRRRLRSVKNTQQITKAMKMVAAAKLRRAQERVIGARPYAKLLLGCARARSRRRRGSSSTRSSRCDPRRTVIVLVVAGDRGLCRRLQHQRQPRDGAPARGASRVDGSPPAPGRQEGRRVLEAAQVPAHREDLSRHLRRRSSTRTRGRSPTFLAQEFLAERIDAVYIVVNEFRSILSQVVQAGRLLPLVDGAGRFEGRQDPRQGRSAGRLPLRARRADRSWRGSCRDTWSSPSSGRSPSPPRPRWARA